MRLQLDNKTCAVIDAYLLYSRRDDIQRVSLGDGIIADSEFVVDIGTHSAAAIDCLVTSNRLFWTDGTAKVRNINVAFVWK